ncbi:MAG: hypothetical protein COB23_09125 [Methylophaga sp.]|nr:MAG: hypothetical protein COB23_09125 [Methylophaga sp.]
MSYLQPVITYLDTLNLREKILSLLVLIVIIYSAWDAAFYAGYSEQQQQLSNTQLELDDQRLELENSIAGISDQLENEVDPNVLAKQQLASAKQQLESVQQDLNSVLATLVPPTKITQVLRDVLAQSNDLSLISLNNEPVIRIELAETKTETEQEQLESGEKENIGPSLYSHTTVVKLSGNYQQLYQYLQTLESSPWGLFWKQLDYKVTQYPNAEITLQVFTISTKEHWLGL